jgi:hypothetical protein
VAVWLSGIMAAMAVMVVASLTRVVAIIGPTAEPVTGVPARADARAGPYSGIR